MGGGSHNSMQNLMVSEALIDDMRTFLCALLATFATAVVLLRKRTSRAHSLDIPEAVRSQYQRFEQNYLIVYSLMVAGDWLQGPYMYALYEYYGYSMGDIGILFIAGFGSSLVFGTFAGSACDTAGRRKGCLGYAASYSLSCVLKHSPNYTILMIGRLLGGISTSLLFCAFEAWLVTEHRRRGFPAALLPLTFGRASFTNGLVAVGAGCLGQWATDVGGPVAPFDVAAIVMIAGAVVVGATWPENYGDTETNQLTSPSKVALNHQKAAKAMDLIEEAAVAGEHRTMDRAVDSEDFDGAADRSSGSAATSSATGGSRPESLVKPDASCMDGILQACRRCVADSQIYYVCLIQSFFESSMYTVIFLWTPAIEHATIAIGLERTSGIALSNLPYGLIFAAFMVAMMVGSLLFDLMALRAVAPETMMHRLLIVAFFSMTLALAFPADPFILILAFCIFEGCCGMYFPTIGTLRTTYIPDDCRSTIMSLARVPLNCIVCITLVFVGQMLQSTVLLLSTTWLLLTWLSLYKLTASIH